MSQLVSSPIAPALLQDSLETAARQLVGTPFLKCGDDPGEGLDCWGLARAVWLRVHGRELPSFSPVRSDAVARGLMVEAELPAWRPVEPSPGVMALFSVNHVPQHVGVMINCRQFIHCVDPAGVCIASLDSPLWARRFRGCYVDAD